MSPLRNSFVAVRARSVKRAAETVHAHASANVRRRYLVTVNFAIPDLYPVV